MRTNSNKKVHNIKRDPYKLLQRVALILALILAVGAGLFYLCSIAVTRDFVKTRDRIETENAEGAAAFQAEMDALRASNNVADKNEIRSESGEDLPFWEKELNGKVWRIQDEGGAGLENTSTITMDRSQLINGGLLLLNSWHSLPADFSEEGLVVVGTTGDYKVPVQDSSVKLFQPAFESVVEALKAAKDEAGLEHYIVMEGYRSVIEQQELFNEKMEDLSSRYTGERLIAETKKFVNYPGTSDYHSGMSFRMDVYERGNSELNDQKFQAQSAQGAWLTENCWRFGIAFRFPSKDFPNTSWEDKSYKTGVSSQLNLYRYVGKAHAAAMTYLDLNLESYLNWLHEKRVLTIFAGAKPQYFITCQPVEGRYVDFQLPCGTEYELSLDNTGYAVAACVL